MVKPYQLVAIEECGESLLPIPLDQFAVVTPHPYVALGAPYEDKSPYFLRQKVLEQLLVAQAQLRRLRPGWRLQIFDAFRPIAVQQFMVDYTFGQLAAAEGVSLTEEMSDSVRSQLQEKVATFWAIPNTDPLKPPPHSTGAAVDLSLVNAAGIPVDMGCAIDEISPRAYPNHFARSRDRQAQQYHTHRCLLAEAMTSAGFRQHPNEWWHFSLGDQLWAWQIGPRTVARYGNAQLL